MERHYISKMEILSLIKDSKGKIIDIQESFLNPGWLGYRYCVTKE
jgi:hypothetical protein